MADAGGQVAAELAYQRALAALHEARSDLADVAAARRRLAYERVRLDAAEVDARERALGVRFTELSTRADQLRDEAVRLRDVLHRHAADGMAEPDELPAEPAFEGFEQPPYPGPGM
ncbi:MAG: hypothetical protein KDB60_13095 [Propionibacteriaceae bacterium]|nr:hypothetical protein [Propionibacteriaceae bacterium]